MRGLWFLVMLAACRIPDEVFIKGDARPVEDAADGQDGTDAPADGGLGPFAQRAYIKASNTGMNDNFGESVALSADGTTLAVAASYESSGVPTDPADNSAQGAGAVYVFTRTGGTWTQQAYLKASNPATGDSFGSAIALSADGSTLAVSAPGEDSNALGINGNQSDNSALGSGAVYVFTRAGSVWSQQVYVKASNTEAADAFGVSLSLAGDGSTLAVGANGEDGQGFGNQTDNTLAKAGAAYVFVRSGTTWNQQAYIKASNPGINDQFGGAVALSANGTTLAVGAYFESGGSVGVNGNQASETEAVSGAVYVLTRTGTTWTQQAYVKASNTGSGDLFGAAVALNGDGSTLAVDAYGEASASTGIDGDQANNTAGQSGAIYVFTRSGTTWSQQAYVKASNTDANDYFGRSFLALSMDGSTLATGAFYEDSADVGIDGDQANNNASDAGAAYLFKRTGATWAQSAYIKASNTEMSDRFGEGGALSADGVTLAVGAVLEDSAATGIDGNQADNATQESGAAYVYQ
ncbi:hypothetical protein BH11MYX2_BH11MYX2_04030 [soil metagenome]